MMKRRRLFLIVCGLICAAGLALGLGRQLPPVYANVTLEYFTATYLPGTQEVRLDWKTATEIDTAAFYITRSNSSTGPYAMVSDYISPKGDTINGWTYVFTDVVPALNRTYYYFLEAVNNDQSLDPHGPISVAAGVPNTNTPTPTRTSTATSTRTRTPTPTATLTTQPTTDVSVPSDSSIIIQATPRLATGETITPQPTPSSKPPSPVVYAAVSTPAAVPTHSQPAVSSATSVPPANTSPLATPVPPPTAMDIMQASALALAPAAATPGIVAPVVVATDAAPPAAPADANHGDAFILIVAAILFLGIAFVIVRQARQ